MCKLWLVLLYVRGGKERELWGLFQNSGACRDVLPSRGPGLLGTTQSSEAQGGDHGGGVKFVRVMTGSWYAGVCLQVWKVLAKVWWGRSFLVCFLVLPLRQEEECV